MGRRRLSVTDEKSERLEFYKEYHYDLASLTVPRKMYVSVKDSSSKYNLVWALA